VGSDAGGGFTGLATGYTGLITPTRYSQGKNPD